MLLYINKERVDMKNVGLIVNKGKDNDYEVTRKVAAAIRNAGMTVFLFDQKLLFLAGHGIYLVSESEFIKNIDAVFSLGGDGTLLNVAASMFMFDKPIMGINLGHLGFLTETDENDINSSIQSIVNNEYYIEERMLFKVDLNIGEEKITSYCLNDFVISRGGSPRLVTIKAYIDDAFVDSFTGDGIIVSTPTGSTAYSLSCGGPIADPSMKLIIITPICPHNIYSRTFLADSSKSVKIEVVSKNEYHGLVTFDGQGSYQIDAPVRAVITTADKTLKLIRTGRNSFYDLLRKKLYNRGE